MLSLKCRPPGQESVWNYPRPAIAEPLFAHVVVVLGGQVIAETREVVRSLETSHPPCFYLPPDAIRPGALVPAAGSSFCEWKGRARYFDVLGGDQRRQGAAWSYPAPNAPFALLRDFIAFYPALMDACLVDGERVVPQPGGFYGGWITSRVAGPFKGVSGQHRLVRRAVVIGAGGGIGRALVSLLAESDAYDAVHALSRKASIAVANGCVRPARIDVGDPASIAAAAAALGGPVDLVVVATGLLHVLGHRPERSLAELDADWLTQLFRVNTIGPALVLRHFAPLLATDRPHRVCSVVSAGGQHLR